jgi:hypothetical protein
MLLAACAGGAYASIASAGANLPFPVSINTILAVASGSLGSARNSPDSVQYMYCLVTGTATSLTGQCFAHDAGIQSAKCTTTNPNLVGAIQEIPPDAYVSFTWDAFGNCTALQVINASRLEIKKP